MDKELEKSSEEEKLYLSCLLEKKQYLSKNLRGEVEEKEINKLKNSLFCLSKKIRGEKLKLLVKYRN